MNVEAVSLAFAAVFTPYNMLVVCGGTILGIFIGAMPGMSSVMGLSIMLPFTFQLHGYASIMMLLAIFCGSIYGGSISATLRSMASSWRWSPCRVFCISKMAMYRVSAPMTA